MQTRVLNKWRHVLLSSQQTHFQPAVYSPVILHYSYPLCRKLWHYWPLLLSLLQLALQKCTPCAAPSWTMDGERVTVTSRRYVPRLCCARCVTCVVIGEAPSVISCIHPYIIYSIQSDAGCTVHELCWIGKNWVLIAACPLALVWMNVCAGFHLIVTCCCISMCDDESQLSVLKLG